MNLLSDMLVVKIAAAYRPLAAVIYIVSVYCLCFPYLTVARQHECNQMQKGDVSISRAVLQQSRRLV